MYFSFNIHVKNLCNKSNRSLYRVQKLNPSFTRIKNNGIDAFKSRIFLFQILNKRASSLMLTQQKRDMVEEELGRGYFLDHLLYSRLFCSKFYKNIAKCIIFDVNTVEKRHG
jgi:hypothetical protein